MINVFIHSSRKDKEFIRKLHEALSKHNRDTWLNWENIPLTAEWWKELEAEISFDGKLIASASRENRIILKNPNDHKHKMLRHRGQVNAVTFLPDGKLIASASVNK